MWCHCPLCGPEVKQIFESPRGGQDRTGQDRTGQPPVLVCGGNKGAQPDEREPLLDRKISSYAVAVIALQIIFVFDLVLS